MERITNEKYLITSALPYANGPLHVGHVAGVHLPADIYYRFMKLVGKDCQSLCGTDEHGVGIEIAAKKETMSEKELVTMYKAKIFSTLSKISIDYDIIEGTSIDDHIKLSQDFFQKLVANEYIEKRDEKQMYCGDCDKFLPDRYIEGICPHCGNPGARGDQCERCSTLLDPTELVDPCCKICNNTDVTVKDTYNYYFLLSKLESKLDEWLEHKDYKKNVKTTAKKWINEGLSDRSISRDIKRGIPVPGDEEKKMYVWFEAPISYISFLKDKAAEIWGKEANSKIVHFLGKDNIPFHTIMRPAVILAHGEYKLPDDVVGNEFVNLEGNKISTSRNHAVWLHDMVEKYNPDYIRNYLIQCIPETKDSNFSREEFKNKSDNIAGSLGNLLNRVNTFYDRYFEGKTANSSNDGIIDLDMNELKHTISDLIQQYKMKDAFAILLTAVKELNRCFAINQPWNLIKTDKEKAYAILNIISEYLINISVLLHPFLPQTAEKIMQNYNMNIQNYSYDDIGNISLSSQTINNAGFLFTPLNDEDIKKELLKLLK